MSEKATARPARLRCAIYTRKSTEEGLEQEFNTLHAQREACEAFVVSQKHAGWEVVADLYDDGGFTGANMDRPALGRLLADIEAKRVDVVLVYKVDRLSRSLLDFARIMETFDRGKVSFVSVTQQFNTASSLGRLVLNMLLSFAQFEREMIAERTRDKICAARRRGKWTGGIPPLGYDVAPEGGKLVVNAEEAEQVRAIFAMYLEERSLLRCVELLNGRGSRTKAWTTQSERRRDGKRWEKSGLRKLLTSAVYIGKVDFKGTLYDGEHAGIVEPAVFANVQTLLSAGKREPGRDRNVQGFLLRGLVRCVACGSVMTSTSTSPRGRPYRYYSCTEPRRRGTTACPVRSVPAAQLERFVVERIREMGKDPGLYRDTLEEVVADRERERPALEKEQRTLQAELGRLRDEAGKLVAALGQSPSVAVSERLAEVELRTSQVEQRLAEVTEALAAIDRTVVHPEDVARALALFDPVWEALTVREQAGLLHELIESIDYDGTVGEIAIAFRPTGIAALAAEAVEAAA